MGAAFLVRDLEAAPVPSYDDDAMAQALKAIDSTISKLRKIPAKLAKGSAQYSCVLRKIEAFTLVRGLIWAEYES